MWNVDDSKLLALGNLKEVGVKGVLTLRAQIQNQHCLSNQTSNCGLRSMVKDPCLRRSPVGFPLRVTPECIVLFVCLTRNPRV